MLTTRVAVVISGAIFAAVLLSAHEPAAPPAAQKPPAPQGVAADEGVKAAATGCVSFSAWVGRLTRSSRRGARNSTRRCVRSVTDPTPEAPRGPSLIRSEIVLHDDKGELIGPVLLNGRPEKGMPAMSSTTPDQIAEIAEYLHLLVERAANRGLYETLYANNILTGDAKAGEAFFSGAGGCGNCHSPSGDLAHVASKYQPINLQNRWLWPSGGRGVQATVTLTSGERITGTIKRLDDFDVSIVDATGAYRSWPRQQVSVEVSDPLKAHRELLGRYSDADIHNVTAYLATLK